MSSLPSSRRLVFALDSAAMADDFGRVATAIHRRGAEVILVAASESIAARMAATWGDRIINAEESRSDPGSDCSAAISFWRQADLTDAALIVAEASTDFARAAMARAQHIHRPILTLTPGPLRRAPFTMETRLACGPESSADDAPGSIAPLWPLEQDRLAATRESFCRHTTPFTAGRPYVFFPLLPTDDPSIAASLGRLFANQHEAVRAVLGALSSEIDLYVQPHAAEKDEVALRRTRALMRTHDRWVDPDEDTLGFVSGAAVVVTPGRACGIEALLWDRPVVALGPAHYTGKSFTFDFDGTRPLRDLLHHARAGARSADVAAAQDRYLYDVFHRNAVEVVRDSDGRLEPDSAARLAERIAAILRIPLRTDWSAILAALSNLENTVQEGLSGFFAPLRSEQCLVFASDQTAAWFAPFVAPHQIVSPEDADEVPSTVLGDAVCAVFMPDAPPRAVDDLIRRLGYRGAEQVVDLARVIDHRAVRGPAPACPGPSTPALQQYLSSIAETAPATLLQLGCPDPAKLSLLHESLPQVEITLVDDHEDSLAAAQIATPPNVRVVAADVATGLPFDRGDFDVVASCGALSRMRCDALDDQLANITALAPRAAIHCETLPATVQSIHEHYWARFGPVDLTVQSADPPDGGRRLLASWRFDEPMLTVLAMHALGDAPDARLPERARRRFLSVDRFISILSALINAGHRFVTLTEAVELLAGHAPLPQRVVALTFDDGHRSIFTHAFPLLNRLAIRATVFPVTATVNGRLHGLPSELDSGGVECMTGGQLRELDSAGWDVGSHSVTHPIFAHLTPQQVRTELADSRKFLEDLLGSPVRHFAVPHGEADAALCAQHVEQLRAEGYTLALSARPGFVSRARPCIVWPRIVLDSGSTPQGVQRRLAAIHRETSGWPTAPDTPREELPADVRRIIDECMSNAWTAPADASPAARRMTSTSAPGGNGRHIPADPLDADDTTFVHMG